MEKKALTVMTEPFFILSYSIQLKIGVNSIFYSSVAFCIYTISDLLKYFTDVLDELKQRGVVRTRNTPVADYAEWLVAQSLGLSLERNSRAGYDAMNAKKERFQIKSRRLDPSNKSRQLLE